MELILGLGTAFWIGILTSISPCPLATNIAAVSFISKKVHNSKMVLLTGALYTLGRMFAYTGITFFVIKSIYSIPGLSHFLQTQIHKILGPLLIVVGMFLVELISISLPNLSSSNNFQKIFKNMGIWGAFPLGAIFALSFCPISAAFYFGSLIPLSTKFSSSLLLPSMYGLGTGAPVFIFAILLTLGTGWVGKIFKNVEKFERCFRMATGVTFITVGIYLTMSYILGIF